MSKETNSPPKNDPNRKHAATNDPCICPRQEIESLLSHKGQAQKRVQELTSLCERQRSKLAEAALRAKEMERVASAAKEDTGLAEALVREDGDRNWRGGSRVVVFSPP